MTKTRNIFSLFWGGMFLSPETKNMLTTIILLASVGLIALTIMSFIGGIYANRSALPAVGAVFVALLLFGALWG